MAEKALSMSAQRGGLPSTPGLVDAHGQALTAEFPTTPPAPADDAEPDAPSGRILPILMHARVGRVKGFTFSMARMGDEVVQITWLFRVMPEGQDQWSQHHFHAKRQLLDVVFSSRQDAAMKCTMLLKSLFLFMLATVAVQLGLDYEDLVRGIYGLDLGLMAAEEDMPVGEFLAQYLARATEQASEEAGEEAPADAS